MGRNRSTSAVSPLFVIPAPFGSEASKREQAGTHSPQSKLSLRLARSAGNAGPSGVLSDRRASWQLHGSRPVPARAFQALAAPDFPPLVKWVFTWIGWLALRDLDRTA